MTAQIFDGTHYIFYKKNVNKLSVFFYNVTQFVIAKPVHVWHLLNVLNMTINDQVAPKLKLRGASQLYSAVLG